MGQKINPHGLRVGVIQDWDSRWYVGKSNFGETLVEDYNLRKTLKKQFYAAGIPKIEIERDASRVRVNIHCAKPGIIIGRGGTEIEKLKVSCEKVLQKPVSINIVEVRNPDANAQLVAESIASQLEKRTSFRRAMKNAIGRAMRLGCKGIKTMVSGRLGGAEIARRESYHEGTIPLQTIRADIDYGFAEANTTYGKIGVKVWIYKGEVLAGEKTERGEVARRKQRDGRDDRRRNDRRPRYGEGTGGQRPAYNNNYAGGQRPAYNNQSGGQRPAYNNQSGGQRPAYNNQSGGQRPVYNNQSGATRPAYNNSNNAPGADASRPPRKEGGNQ